MQQTVRVNFALELGTIAEMATVAGVSPLVETSNATVGTVIENRRIVELPLNGRNYLQLVALSPNVSAEFAGPGQAGDRQGGSRANQQLSISGQRREFNNYTLDGVDNTDVNFNTYIFLPSVDALEEFKVQTGVYSAEFGRGASQVNVVTKSGTNSLHGTMFEFHRDDALDARPYAFTAAQAAAPKAPFKWDQYGYTAGGPVWKNHLFFMSNFEGYRDRKQFQNPYSVPSTAMRSGDFSELLSNLGAVNAADRTAHRRDRRPDAVHGGRHDADLRAVSGQHHSREPPPCHLQAVARVLSGAQLRHRWARQQPSGAAGSRDRQIPVHAAHGRAARAPPRPGWAATATPKRTKCSRR